ncbi:MAG: VOC family protein [Candidatus Kapabacteria bacterium]|nr:VOC family protein [Candidatus Kapabacteria bacterium]
MSKVNIYLNFSGNTEDAFKFYQSAFATEINFLQRFKDIPNLPGAETMNEEDLNKIMHISLPITENCFLMGTDALEKLGHKVVFGNNFHISVDANSKSHADELFSKLSNDGTITQSLADMFWGAYFGSLTDKFGVQWMINYHNKLSNK